MKLISLLVVVFVFSLAGTGWSDILTEAVIALGKDNARCRELLMPLAENGNPEYQYYVGLSYEYDHKSADASHWIRRAAEAGYDKAQVELGHFYRNGYFYQKNYVEAARWFLKVLRSKPSYADAESGLRMLIIGGAVDSLREFYGDSNFQRILGDYLATHDNNSEAVRWFYKSAQQGDTCAASSLDYLINQGKGIDGLRECAEEGDARCQFNIGIKYLKNTQYAEGLSWTLKAANQGYSAAQYNLGLVYFRGIGVDKNIVEARKWANKAAEQGIKEADGLLKEIDSAGN